MRKQPQQKKNPPTKHPPPIEHSHHYQPKTFDRKLEKAEKYARWISMEIKQMPYKWQGILTISLNPMLIPNTWIQ